MPFPAEIRTARLRLRRPAPEDAEAVHAGYARDPEVSRYLSWRPHRSLGETRAAIAFFMQLWDMPDRRSYVIDAADAPCVGGIDLRMTDDGRGVAFGYVLRRDRWGQGLMTEALSAGLDAALAVPGVWRAWAYCDVANPASARVMEKAGMQFEGVLRRWALHPNVDPLRPRDCRVYSRVRGDPPRPADPAPAH
ncbi:alanine acetyltransferase [Allostella sp. ATCC 35155]|nr:alanine acetyltransferase [Stella sp. ATCC 35155]